MEPELSCEAALWVPDSGLVDVPELIGSFLAQLQAHAGLVVYRSAVSRVAPRTNEPGFQIETADGDSVSTLQLINSAGLQAVALAQNCAGWPRSRIPAAWYARGHYYTSTRPVPFRHLVYPLPDAAGLGVHLGFDLAGRARFGPDLRWCETPDYRFDDSQRGTFASAVRAWWPALENSDLQPDFVGVRPKISGPGLPNADFRIEDGASCGMPGMIHLFGIESPGLTSSLALAERIATVLAPVR
jgi:L-2-hydroxyglutarate oxidase LhgO